MKGVDKSKRTNQRYRYSDRRNKCFTPVEQEEEDQNDDDDPRFLQGSDYFLYRVADNRGRVKRNYVLDAGRKRLGKLDHHRFCSLIDVERVRIRQLLYANADGFVPAVQQVGVVAFGANFRAPNILELHNPILGVLDDDVFEFL